MLGGTRTKLHLKREEIKEILLDWAANNVMPDKFNSCEFEGYSYEREAVLSWEEPEDAK